VGSQLLAAFLEELRTRGIKSVNLTTDQQDNDQVNAFYLAQGFRCTRTFVTPEGRTMNEYVLKLKGVEV
jgi:hypothetical protein